MYREIITEMDLNNNGFNFKNINEKKIKTIFEILNIKLVQINLPENKNFLLFYDMSNLYKLNVKSIHENDKKMQSKLVQKKKLH